MTPDAPWMTAGDAARALRVTPSTLYAYVSRGLVRSESAPGLTRRRRYSRDDIERLRRRTEVRRDPDKAAARALQWGMPILESSITSIADSALYYRGHDAVELSRSRSIEEVASLMWSGGFDAACSMDPARIRTDRTPHDDLPFVPRAQAGLAAASAADLQAFDLRPSGVMRSGWRILALMARLAGRRRASAPTIEDTLARAWGVKRPHVDLLRAAIILCADHELNVSTFTARCVASAGSNPYAVVIAGLAALEGTRHGGASVRVESMLGALARTRNVQAALRERLRRGETIDGFGHPLYRNGDPRAAALMQQLRGRCAQSPRLALIGDVAEAAAAMLREEPTIDFALAALARVLRLPAGSPLTLFAIGRTIGWLAHAIEQYGTGQVIRPRAKYIGAAPVGAAS